MTDADTFAAICADFPFDSNALDAIYNRLLLLLRKTQNGSLGGRDGTIDGADWKRLQVLTWAMHDLVATMRLIEQDGDPDGWIPF